ncbi:hypothetical protein Cni_G06561 [Canna indica]|uniref:Uncharacterized protein n=1 Tax=Canna indica TaxID=4628 RepID=A0AAQ3Q4W4_9LILI|nr:hypothetical protein Cni_G06561 [Canna indica]
MRRQGQYSDSGINPMVAAQMQHMSGQRLQLNSGSSHFAGGSDSFRSSEEHQYMSSKSEGQWQWDRDGQKGSNQISSQSYKEGHGNDISRTLYEGQMSDSKLGMEMQGTKDPRAHARQDELEGRFDDSTFPQTFEGLEQNFFNDLMNLTKEQHEAEDRENARHRERLNEINVQYQEKLMAVRARQATHREEFLRKDAQVRHQQYQQATGNSYQTNAGVSDAHGFGSSANATNTFVDAHRGYAAGHYESYGERAEYAGGARGRGFGSRGQHSGGRAYSSRGRGRYF